MARKRTSKTRRDPAEVTSDGAVELAEDQLDRVSAGVFVKIGDIGGESKDSTHKPEIDLATWSR